MRRGRPPYPDLLTPREQEVLALLREGLTNQQIADRLGIGLYGARYHVSEILSKLGVSSREEAARWEGEAVWGFAGIGALLSILKRPRWEVLMKGTSMALLATAAGLVILLAGGVVLALSTDSDPEADDGPAPTSVASNDPETTREFEPPEYQELGPYRVAPVDYQGDTSTQLSPLALPPEQRGPVAANLDDAKASSLFPQNIPEGYDLIEADSNGRPSELFLRLVFDGPEGPITVERSRPIEMPIDHRYDASTSHVQFAFFGSSRGFSILPDGGDDESPGGYLRGMDGGIDTALYGPQVSVVEARDFYRTMVGDLGEPTAQRILPALDRRPESLPRPEDITHSGPCTIDVVVHPNYVWREVDMTIASWMECFELVPLSPCEPGSVYMFPGLEVACDAEGFRIDTRWDITSPRGSCESHGQAYVQDPSTLVAAQDRCVGGGGGSGANVPIEACITIRDQESCASFDYVVP